MIKSLKEKKWGKFTFENIFTIYSTNSGIDKNKLQTIVGGFPYITRTDKNNGIDNFYGNQNEKYSIDRGNVITIGLDTQTVFYQPYSFYTGQNIQILESNHLNIYIAFFLIPLIKKQLEKFNWGGNGATLTRLKRSVLLLPIDETGNPDRSYMESYMRQLEHEKLQAQADSYFRTKLASLPTPGDITPLSEKVWDEFFLEDVFPDIQRGKRLKKADHISGNAPYISSTANNNGIDGYIGNNTNVRKFENCLTLANSGSVGSTFYHPYSFIASDHVTKLENSLFSKYTYLFVATKVKEAGVKYGFNREINDTRIKREKILLPITDDGLPDYSYMEQYMQQVEYRLLQIYLQMKKKIKES